MDGGAWKAAVHGVAKGWTRLSDFTFTFHFHALEKEMATHSSVLAWRIPGTGETGGLLSMGSHRVGHDWSDLAAAAAAYLLLVLVHTCDYRHFSPDFVIYVQKTPRYNSANIQQPLPLLYILLSTRDWTKFLGIWYENPLKQQTWGSMVSIHLTNMLTHR